MKRQTSIAFALGFVAGLLCRKGLRKSLNALRQAAKPASTEAVETASEDSFPASDAPAWTGTTTK
jgi:hypothetical protein